MTLVEDARATVEDLLREPGKAELIGGRIVRYMPTGCWPAMIAGNIYAALRAFALAGQGIAFGDNVGYSVSELSSGRQSFSPDCSYFGESLPVNLMRFIQGAPAFAVEIRSECDYRAEAEVEMSLKRADYFEAGTLVVWDVDTLKGCVNCYQKSNPRSSRTFSLGESADAEPALPGWRMRVDEIFRK